MTAHSPTSMMDQCHDDLLPLVASACVGVADAAAGIAVEEPDEEAYSIQASFQASVGRLAEAAA